MCIGVQDSVLSSCGNLLRAEGCLRVIPGEVSPDLIVMHLLDMPSEILKEVFDKLGGAQLRRSVAYLLICKRWYSIARQVFLSGLSVASLRFSARDIQLLPPRGSPLMILFRDETVRLSVRLMGHPSPEISETPWISLPETGNNEDSGDESTPTLDAVNATHTWKLSGIDAGKIQHSAHLSAHPQQAWMRRINTKLVELADRLASFTSLEQFMFEASSEREKTAGLRWDYISDATLGKLIARLPDCLTSLTLDTCGTEVVPTSDRPLHLCPLIAENLGRVRTVRLRMRCICPVVFNMTSGQLNLESLTIKMSLPMFEDYNGGNTYFDAERCFSKRTTGAFEHVKAMCLAARVLARRHSFERLWISFRDPYRSGISLLAWDGVTDQRMYDPGENFSYEDDGRTWNAWEESSNLQVDARLF